MNYRRLGKTDLMVSEIGLGGEWLERHSREEVIEVVHSCQEKGINIVDCWMSNPEVRSNIGEGIKGSREKWIIQGQIGSTWQNGQYEKTRDLEPVKAAFQDLLDRFQTDYMDIGMIHFIDEQKDWDHAFVPVKKSRHKKYFSLVSFFKSGHEPHFQLLCFFKSRHIRYFSGVFVFRSRHVFRSA